MPPGPARRISENITEYPKCFFVPGDKKTLPAWAVKSGFPDFREYYEIPEVFFVPGGGEYRLCGKRGLEVLSAAGEGTIPCSAASVTKMCRAAKVHNKMSTFVARTHFW